MEKKESNKIFQRYILSSLFVLTLYIGAVVLVTCLYHNLWSFLICLVLYFPVKVLIRVLANKIIGSILFDNLDALKFQQVISDNKYFVPPLSYRINAALFTGEYQTVVNIASSQIQMKNCSVRKKYFYLSLLALIYFELRDFEKLKVLLTQYEELKAAYPSKSFLATPNPTWNYYWNFLEENYEDCKTICKEQKLELNPKAWDFKIKKLQNDFFHAVACYENGESNEAMECFKSIISYAPLMNYADIAQAYLRTFKRNQPPVLLDTEILPDSICHISNVKPASLVIRYCRVIKKVSICIITILILLSAVLDYVGTKSEIEWCEKLDAALAEQYGQATSLITATAKKDGEIVDSLCLANVADRLTLVEVVTYDDGQTLAILEVVENIVWDTHYFTKNLAGDYYIGFAASSSMPSNEQLYFLEEFYFNGKSYWFYIDYVETTPKR